LRYAWYLLKGRHKNCKKGFTAALIVAAVLALDSAAGHMSSINGYETQPAKMAAF
jgi:cytochrome bd-type quinol oxidase subunit 1